MITPEEYSLLLTEEVQRAIAAARGQTLAEMALAWILKDGQVTSVLIGASRPEQILDDLKALDNTAFTPDELRAIDAASGF